MATSAPTALTYVAGSISAVSSSATTIYAIGCGKETGNDATNQVKVYATITADAISSTVLN